MNLLLLFSFSFLTVCVKAIQARNFSHANYVAIIPVSCILASFDLYITIQIVKEAIVTSFNIIPIMVVGVGSGLGACLGVYIHQRLAPPKLEKSPS